jgi:hypothetical protein
MQTHQATFMQGQPDRTNVTNIINTWDETDFANTSLPDSGLASAACSLPNTSIQMATAIPCNYTTSHKTFKQDARRILS